MRHHDQRRLKQGTSLKFRLAMSVDQLPSDPKPMTVEQLLYPLHHGRIDPRL
jgi:hypothetical protein